MQVYQKCLQQKIPLETKQLFVSLKNNMSETKPLNNNNLYTNQWSSNNNIITKKLTAASQANFSKNAQSEVSSNTYFLKGLDSRILNAEQREELVSFVNQDPFGQSFLVYNSHEALRKLNAWRSKLSWIQPFYALKSNPIDPLVEDLCSNGAGLDVASQGEIKKGLEMGISASNMIYSNPVKEEKDILYAAQNNVLYTTADTFDEIVKIHTLAPNMKILWRISITEDNSQQLATVFSNKFGDDITSLEDAHQKFKFIAQELGVRLHGIHFHCGSGKNGSSSFLKAVNMARKCIEIGRQYGHAMEILDLGGGYPSGDLNDKFIANLKDTCNDPLGYRVIAEPGRHFSSQTCYLFTRILAKRNKQGKTCFHLNDSLYHSFNCVLMDGVSFENDNDQFYSVVNNNTLEKSEINKSSMINSSIFGMTCDGADVIARNVGFCGDAKVGDWLCFSGMGSYTFGPKSAFNGMESTTRVFKWSSPVGAPESPKKAAETSEEPSLIWKPKLEPAF
ncbi:hypothetical protein ABPG74_008991 [Tetrahymena malaccensis]